MYSIIPLEKHHFQLIENNNYSVMRITHPQFKNKRGWVLFFTAMCPQCQDTKTTWFALGVLKMTTSVNHKKPWDTEHTYIRRSNVQRFPQLVYVTENGIIVNSPSNVDHVVNVNGLVKYVCQEYGLGGCCQQLPSQC